MRFLVPVIVNVEVNVPDSGDIEFDRREAESTADTFVTKRLSTCSWGHGNPWTANIYSTSLGYPTLFNDDYHDDDDDYDNDYDDDEEEGYSE